MTRPIMARIDRNALAHNVRVLCQAAPTSRLWAVIKANAYGHGVDHVFSALEQAHGIAMLDLEEALRCRELGWKKPLLLLEGFFSADDLALARQHQLSVVIHDAAQLDIWQAHPPLANQAPLSVYLKLNSGMNRLGFAPPALDDAYSRLRELDGMGDITLMTHFASADEPAGITDALQCFDACFARLRKNHPDAPPLSQSLCNSAGLLAHPQAHRDWVRTGIALYGSSPFQNRPANELDLRPVMHLSSQLIGTQSLQAGERVGYGGIFTATEPLKIGIVACGYADGYPRHAPTGTPVVVAGQRTRLLGRVSMDMLAVDLSGIAGAGVGSSVTLWGAEGLSVDEVAQAAGTIGYELLCALAPRVPTQVC